MLLDIKQNKWWPLKPFGIKSQEPAYAPQNPSSVPRLHTLNLATLNMTHMQHELACKMQLSQETCPWGGVMCHRGGLGHEPFSTQNCWALPPWATGSTGELLALVASVAAFTWKRWLNKQIHRSLLRRGKSWVRPLQGRGWACFKEGALWADKEWGLVLPDPVMRWRKWVRIHQMPWRPRPDFPSCQASSLQRPSVHLGPDGALAPLDWALDHLGLFTGGAILRPPAEGVGAARPSWLSQSCPSWS